VVTYDSHLLDSDGFFASFLTREDANLLIIEDADDLLQARSEGNKLVEKLLNASDGMVSFSHKKLIFSTNLPNINMIDPALIRPGRCFDILEFRRLNQEEANVVAQNYYGDAAPKLEGKDFSLAEITNLRSSDDPTTEIPKIGFV
jgi:SpoVK/Ycf46/Vps4 family AAA+-type ATPase